MPEHCASGQCQRPAKCVNCSGDHPANSKECPQWEKEKKILKIKCEQKISFPEACKQYEQFYQAKKAFDTTWRYSILKDIHKLG